MVSLSNMVSEKLTLTTDKLLDGILAATNRQVAGLQVRVLDGGVFITGRSKSYYVKQLVTKAVMTQMPSFKLHNEICVCAN